MRQNLLVLLEGLLPPTLRCWKQICELIHNNKMNDANTVMLTTRSTSRTRPAEFTKMLRALALAGFQTFPSMANRYICVKISIHICMY